MLLTPETVKLRGSTENKIVTDKNGESVPHLETTVVALVYWILLIMIIKKI